MGAERLKDVERFGKQDPYCVISLGTNRCRTKTSTGASYFLGIVHREPSLSPADLPTRAIHVDDIFSPDGGTFPKWGETMQFTTTGTETEIQVSIFNENTLMKDELIGATRCIDGFPGPLLPPPPPRGSSTQMNVLPCSHRIPLQTVYDSGYEQVQTVIDNVGGERHVSCVAGCCLCLCLWGAAAPESLSPRCREVAGPL